MKSQLWKSLPLGFLASPAACVAGEGGQVIDKQTGAGIAGAFVTVMWTGRVENVVQGHTVCYSVDVVAADNQGRFELPGRAPDSAPLMLSKRETKFAIYAPGYEEYPIQRGFPRRAEMQPYSGSVSSRLQSLQSRLSFRCATGRASERRLVPLAEAMEKEALAIAKTDKEKSLSRILQSGLQMLREGKVSSGEGRASR